MGQQPATAWRGVLGVVCLVLGLAQDGCRSDSGPERYELSGSVTYNGQPVPAGYILFEPDKSKGNDGPGSSADIEDGRYRTPPGQGVIGGPHIVTICGFDGKPIDLGQGQKNPQGNPLFMNYQITVDLPKHSTTHDFHVSLEERKR